MCSNCPRQSPVGKQVECKLLIVIICKYYCQASTRVIKILMLLSIGGMVTELQLLTGQIVGKAFPTFP